MIDLLSDSLFVNLQDICVIRCHDDISSISGGVVDVVLLFRSILVYKGYTVDGSNKQDWFKLCRIMNFLKCTVKDVLRIRIEHED